MTGRDKGLTGQLLRINPHLLNIHCIAHRLALCTSQAAEGIPALKEYQETLTSLFYYFKGSACRTQKLAKVQSILDEPQLKVKEIHQVRWLSFYTALETIYRTLDSLLTYFDSAEARKDPKAVGLYKKMASKHFIYITYLMMDVMPIVTALSQLFQKKDLVIALAPLSVQQCIRDMQGHLDKNGPFLVKLEEDMVGKTFKTHKITDVTKATMLSSTKNKFINKLIDNIQARFPDSDLLSAFSILGMRPISVLSGEELQKWGDDKLDLLISHYGAAKTHHYKQDRLDHATTSEAVLDPMETRKEWSTLKEVVKAEMYPTDNIQILWNLISKHHKDEFPNLQFLGALCLTAPVHTADCERSFSVQNRLVTSLRNRLTPEHCKQMMTIILEGPPMMEYDFTPAMQNRRKSFTPNL